MREQAGSPMSSSRPLGDASSFQSSRPVPEQANMDQQDAAAIIRQVGRVVVKFFEGQLEITPGLLRKHVIGERDAELYTARGAEVKDAIAFWSGRAGTPKEWIDRAFENGRHGGKSGVLRSCPEPARRPNNGRG